MTKNFVQSRIVCFSISLLITALLILTLSLPVAAYSSHGSGTADDPYQISTFNELDEIRYNLSAHYILMNDLDWNDSDQQWKPIGYVDNNFNGTFNGNMKEIKNLDIGSSEPGDVNRCAGLFGATSEDAVISNLTLRNAMISNGQNSQYTGSLVGNNKETVISNSTLINLQYAGSLVGYNKGTVINCRIIDTVIFSDWYLGGMIGTNSGGLVGTNTGMIENCSTEGSITGTDAGGLAGANDWGTIKTSFSNATVTGIHTAGGLVGMNYEGNISNCMSEGSVFGDYLVGGFAGCSILGTIEYCYTKNTVDGQTQVGGFVGVNQGYLNNCIAINEHINGVPPIRIESSLRRLPFINFVLGVGEPVGRITYISAYAGPDYTPVMENIYSWEETKTNRWRFGAVNGIVVQTEELQSFPGSVWSGWDQTIWEKGEDEFPIIKQKIKI
ncbi:MAG: hypothetical protein LBU81_03995 [Methanosarcinales archaeon]|nr:hypothetical protein [Methanosarcinales archaeon]